MRLLSCEHTGDYRGLMSGVGRTFVEWPRRNAVVLVLPVLIGLLRSPQAPPLNAELAARVSHLLHTVLTTDDDGEKEAAKAEAKAIFTTSGLPTISDIGDEAAYEFVVLTCSPGPADFATKVLKTTKAAVARRMLPQDAALYCEARIRLERVKAEANQRRPTHPALRAQIEQLFVSDQAVRQTKDFDLAKMAEADHEHETALTAMFDTYGVPTYAMVGTEAAEQFAIMVQHQSPALRRKVLPKLKTNVDVGQADPGIYAMMFDRSRRDVGRMQRYGENLECNDQNPTLHESPIEDETHVNLRRARLGLMRIELYARLVRELSPTLCQPGHL